MNQPPSIPKKRHSFQPLLVARPHDAGVGSQAATPVAAGGARAPEQVRGPSGSHVRLRAPTGPLPRATAIDYLDAQELLDELCEDQLTLSMNLACLEESVQKLPRDASARAAARTLDARIADLSAMRDALANVQTATTDPRLQRVVVPDSPLADYLRGIYAWVHAAVRALEQLVGSVHALRPDWALLRWRLEEAKNFHFDELHDSIRSDLAALGVVASGGSFGSEPPPIGELTYAVERVFATATALEEHLDERFGG